jgi:L-asparaginase
MWQALAALIGERYEDYDGFVVLHGTDTMSYSASALSFMLDDLEKPVVFTGSQLPIGRPRTDGKENLVSAVEIASAKDAQGHALVPEVTIFFDSKLMRGNRTTKVSAEDFDAFHSPNIPPLAEAGINIRYFSPLIRHPETYGKPLKVNTALDTRVSILKVHPGITPQVVSNILLGAETRAVIIETYGSGNAISKDWFIRLLKVADDMGKILVNVTQCLHGSVNMDIYATGRRLKEAGVVSGFDSTAESMLAKLFHLMGASTDNAWVKSKLEENLKGEISE